MIMSRALLCGVALLVLSMTNAQEVVKSLDSGRGHHPDMQLGKMELGSKVEARTPQAQSAAATKTNSEEGFASMKSDVATHEKKGHTLLSILDRSKGAVSNAPPPPPPMGTSYLRYFHHYCHENGSLTTCSCSMTNYNGSDTACTTPESMVLEGKFGGECFLSMARQYQCKADHTFPQNLRRQTKPIVSTTLWQGKALQ